MASVAFALGLGPHKQVLVDPQPGLDSGLELMLAVKLTEAFAQDPAEGMAQLALLSASVMAPPTVVFFRNLAHLYMRELCATPGALKDGLPPPREQLAALAAAAPPMRGVEYADEDALAHVWVALERGIRKAAAAHRNGLAGLLATTDAGWHVVGRVCFHLAENTSDPKLPFAFLATYAVGLSLGGRVQHRPLGDALDQYAGANNRAGLVTLLEPVERAAERADTCRQLVDSGDVFHPQAWTASQAHAFLKQVPLMESAGIVVRVPDFWKRRARPRVKATVGTKTPSGIGLDALVDFKVELALEGKALTAAEQAALRKAKDGLVRLRGAWVEVDSLKLEELLDGLQAVKDAHHDGLTLMEAMRMLSGVAPNDGVAAAAETLANADWAHFTSGPWLTRTLQALRDPEHAAGAHPGKDLKATLRPYQEAGVRWLSLLNGLGLGACLADDMGLGKTVQVLSLLLLLKRNHPSQPHLLVCPASLLGNWLAESARFAPGLTVVCAHPSQMDPEEVSGLGASALKGVDAVLTTYGTLFRQQWMQQFSWDTVVLDEAQAIKNADTRQTKATKALKARAKVALTGTPVENRLSDLWSLFDFLNPGLLGNRSEFKKAVKKMEASSYAPLRNLVRPYLLRRLKTDPTVAPDLPEKTEMRVDCGLTGAQARIYQDVVDDLTNQLKQKTGMERRGLVLATLMRLKQVCNHPSQFMGHGGYKPEHSGKLKRLAELVAPMVERQEKVLVFTQFREITEPLAEHLATLFGHPGLVLHGQTPVKERSALVKRFQDDDTIPFMVLSVKAGGVGLNLTAATHVVHFDRWWNPAVENQATDRAFRIGQTRHVMVHKFTCRGTVEERIDAMISDKKQLARQVVDGGGGENLLTEMDNDELLRVVSLDLRRAMETA